MVVFLLVMTALAGCGGEEEARADGGLRVATTTTMVTDLVRQVGGDRIEVAGLMGPGVDPHLYRASQRDVVMLDEADAIFYSGLFLEGKLEDVLERVDARKPSVAVTREIPEQSLLASPDYPDQFDPHVWFDAELWGMAVDPVVEELSALDPEGSAYYERRGGEYRRQLDELDVYVRERVAEIPEGSRVLVTAHDAFAYFGRRYGIDVHGLQGISTEAEAGSRDVQEVAAFLAERRIPAIFVESSVPRRSIEAVQAATQGRGWDVEIGGELYSDALGEPGDAAGTYTGMVQENVDTITEALT